MKYDLGKFPVGPDDNQLKDETGKDATYRQTFMVALTNEQDENGVRLSGKQKYERYDLWSKIKKAPGNDIQFTAEEVVLLKNATQALPLLVAGQARDYLDKPEVNG